MHFSLAYKFNVYILSQNGRFEWKRKFRQIDKEEILEEKVNLRGQRIQGLLSKMFSLPSDMILVWSQKRSPFLRDVYNLV